MKTGTHNIHPKAPLRALVLTSALVAAAGLANAALTDLATSPIATSSTTLVKPNVNFVLDASGSMAWTHAPDESAPFTSKYGYKSFQCNSIYYNPGIIYVPPKKSDGTNYPNSTFTSAWYNGFDTTQGVVNLSTKFKAYDTNSLALSTSAGQNDTPQAAYYYKYTSSATFNYTNTASTFYKECNSAIGSTPGSNVFSYVKVSTTSGPPASPDETTNFANWYSYYRTRIILMKSATGRAFASIGDTYRIGFMTIQATPSTNTADVDYLAISDFDKTQKDAWYKRIYDEDPANGTPLKYALSKAGLNYAGRLGPDPVQYSCQQNFTILTTDGYWNASSTEGVKLDGTTAVGDQDGSITSMPRPMYDANAQKNTLADVAAYYYNTDLRDETTTNPPPKGCNTGVGGVDVCQDNVPVSGLDDAPWQHMTVFTVGLGVNGTLGYTDDYLASPGGSVDYNAIKGGSKVWPVVVGDKLTTIDDLWHAAVNGRGQYFSAKNPDAMVSGLRQALAGVSARKAAGAAAATSNLEPVAGDNYAYVANYRTQKWDGDLQSRTIDIVTGAINSTFVWSAQIEMDKQATATGDTRTIFTYLGGSKVDFATGTFTAAQKTAWFDPQTVPKLTQAGGWLGPQITAATPDTLINYLRGRSENDERGSNTNKLYRQRDHVLGDIINGKPVFVKVPPFNYSENSYATFKTSVSSRQSTVYVAANDGMLHAINADPTGGQELWAYIPSFVLPNLKILADTDYANRHAYFTDGSPTVSDIYTGTGTTWKTILVAGLNAGGKGYYALDVTDPTTPKVLWEFTDANMGYSFGNPIIGKLKSGTWVVVVTSGYNNADGDGHLWVLDANKGTKILEIKTGVGTAASPSGLGRISAWVDDGLNDNTLQRVYGGDMFGNLWRFDINDTIGAAGTEATALATFLYPGSPAVPQPITTKPELGLVGNVPYVYAGTGRYLGGSDTTDTSKQSLYGLREDLAGGLGDVRSKACMVQQTITVINANQRSTSNLPVDPVANCGWFIDFDPGGKTPGERINVDPKLQLGVLAVATNIPEKSVCTVGGSSFLYFFDYAKGTFVSTSTNSLVGQRIGNSIAVGLNTYRLPDGRVVSTVTTSDDQHPVFDNPENLLIGAEGKRVLWRELLQ
jgi:type IV pilus assembly protein PilY1